MFNQSFFWDRLGISNYAIGLFQSNTKWWYAYAIGDATIHCKLGRIVWGSEAAHAEGFSHYERHLRFFRCQRPCLFTTRDWRCGPTHVQNLSPASPSDLHSGDYQVYVPWALGNGDQLQPQYLIQTSSFACVLLWLRSLQGEMMHNYFTVHPIALISDRNSVNIWKGKH